MLDSLDVKIVKQLIASGDFITSEALAQATSASSKTIRNHLANLKELLATHGASLETKQRLGTRLEILHRQKFAEFNETVLNKAPATSDEELFDHLIQKLVTGEGYHKISELADDLYVSRSKLNRLLRELRRILSHYDLYLETKPYHGLRIAGAEFNFRRFLASSYIQQSPEKLSPLKGSEFQRIYGKVESCVAQVLAEADYYLPSRSVDNLSQHLTIALNRIQQGKLYQQAPLAQEATQREKIVAQQIMAKIAADFECQIPEGETQYLLIHLLAKRVIREDQHHTIDTEVNRLVEEILRKIAAEKNIDLMHDLDLRTLLALHLVPLISRLTYGLELKNPLLQEVQVQCVAGFDLAVVANKVLFEKFAVSLSDHELSYLAMHFDVALHREESLVKKKNVLVICPSGRASAQMLKQKFQQYFREHLGEIIVCDLAECENWLKKRPFDYVLTTVPIEKKLSIPVFNFEFFLKENTIQQLEKILTGKRISKSVIHRYFKQELFFPRLAGEDRETVLNQLIDRVTALEGLPPVFKDLIWERENFFSTDFIEAAAVPHPNQLITDETFISVATLEKPIFWHQNKVKVIFLVSISKKDSERYKFLMDWIMQLLSTPTVLTELLTENSYEVLVEALYQIANYGE